MKKSKKSVVQRAKVFELLNGEFNKISSVLNVRIAVNYLLQRINLFQIPTKKFGLKIG